MSTREPFAKPHPESAFWSVLAKENAEGIGGFAFEALNAAVAAREREAAAKALEEAACEQELLLVELAPKIQAAAAGHAEGLRRALKGRDQGIRDVIARLRARAAAIREGKT